MYIQEFRDTPLSFLMEGLHIYHNVYMIAFGELKQTKVSDQHFDLKVRKRANIRNRYN